VAVLGGAKLETKLGLVKDLLAKVDKLLLGGAMIFTFYEAKGLQIGKSVHDPRHVNEAKELLKDDKLVLPVDVVVTKSMEAGVASRIVPVEELEYDDYGLDVGSESVKQFKKTLAGAKTVFWNGPLGYYEVEEYAKATNELAQFLAQADAKVFVGGGDIVSVVERLGLTDRFFHVSTGGGAALAFIQGEELPAIKALERAPTS
jgi:phosphoglycerate kinase